MSESLAVYFLKYGMRKERAGWVGIAHVNEMPGGMGAGVVQRQVEVTGQGTCKRVLHFMAPRIHSLFIFNFDSFHSSFLWVLLFAIPSAREFPRKTANIPSPSYLPCSLRSRSVVAISHPLTTEAISSPSKLQSRSWTGIRLSFIDPT
jgi:hypothetical protein